MSDTENNYEICDYVIFFSKLINQSECGSTFECKHKTKYQNKKLCAQYIGLFSDPQRIFITLNKVKNIQYNKHIVQIYDFFKNVDGVVIVKENHSKENLKTLVKKLRMQNQYFTTSQVLDFIYQFIVGYQALLKLRISHGSMSLQSICFDGQYYQITDIPETILREYDDRDHKSVLDYQYFAFPQQFEVWSSLKCSSCLNDIYSFGMILYNMCFLELPFDQNYPALLNFNQTIQVTEFKIRKDLPINGPSEEKEEIKFLIENMIAYKEYQRISWDTLMSRINISVLYDKFRNQEEDNKYSHLQQSNLLQQSAIKFQLKFNSESENHPLSLFILLLYQKYKLLDIFFILFSQIFGSGQLKCSNQNYSIIASSIVGYQKSLIFLLNQFHQGNMEDINLNMRRHNNNFENNYRCVKSFQKIRTHQDIFLLNCLIETLNNQQIYRHYDQLIQSTIEQIKKQQIRLQNLVHLKYLLENNVLDCQQYSDLITQFCDLYLENQIEKIIENDQPDQIPKNLCLFIVCYFEIQNLERTYPQHDFQAQLKQPPELEWTQKQITQKIVELKRNQLMKK